jgi:hypothetical protein
MLSARGEQLQLCAIYSANLFFDAASLDRSYRHTYARHTIAEHNPLLARSSWTFASVLKPGARRLALAGRILAQGTRTACRLRVRQPRRPVACLRRKLTYTAHILICLPKTANFGTSQGYRPSSLSDTAAATRRAHSASASSRCLLLGDDERLRGAEGIKHSAGDTGLNQEGAHPAGGPLGRRALACPSLLAFRLRELQRGISRPYPAAWHRPGGTSYYWGGAELSPFGREWRQMLQGHVHGETLQLRRAKS